MNLSNFAWPAFDDGQVEPPQIREAHLLEQGIQALSGLLGPEWQVTLFS
ncbi:hypothetical protein ACFCV8_07280 [Streptomyces sp. NPDC056347]